MNTEHEGSTMMFDDVNREYQSMLARYMEDFKENSEIGDNKLKTIGYYEMVIRRKKRTAEILKMIEELPPEERAKILLSKYGELPTEERVKILTESLQSKIQNIDDLEKTLEELRVLGKDNSLKARLLRVMTKFVHRT